MLQKLSINIIISNIPPSAYRLNRLSIQRDDLCAALITAAIFHNGKFDDQ